MRFVWSALLICAMALLTTQLPAQSITTPAIVQGSSGSSASPFCPAERPHRLEIETGTMACSSQSCLGRMDCGTGTCKLVRDLGDNCNSCVMRTYVACLSEQDLKSIRR